MILNKYTHEMSRMFSEIYFQNIPGSCNMSTKRMADFSKENTEPSLWLEKGPTFLLLIVIAELL